MRRIGLFAVLVASALWAGTDNIMNTRGWPSFTEFWRAALSPELDSGFLRLAFDAALVTVAYAALGSLLAIAIGLAGCIVLSKVGWGLVSDPGQHRVARLGWRVARLFGAVPRAAHEIVWGLALVQVLGLDPMVAVLAIGVPYGLVTARVFADSLDHAPHEPFQLLRAQGAGRISALLSGIAPLVRLDVAAYCFYRFECAIRSAAILGIIGAGGLGFQLALSFQTLRYAEVWTLIWALVIVSGLADLWSTTIRRAKSRRMVTMSTVALLAIAPLSWWWVKLDPSILWSERTAGLAADLGARAWPPALGPTTWDAVGRSALDTVAMSILAIAFAMMFAGVLSFFAGGAVGSRPVVLASKALLLLARAVPPPVWAFVVVLVVLPGTWPGALALGIYNLGVLGRLQAEVVENEIGAVANRPTEQLMVSGAGAAAAFATATVPRVLPRFRALGLYRWEVALRETMVVGVVGASGLGRDLNQQLAGRAFDQALTTVLVLVALTLVIDGVAAALRK